MKQPTFISILISLLLMGCNSGSPEWKPLGKIKARHATEIETSKLWIGGEVLDRDLCDYDAYKEYLGELGAKKIRLQSGWAKTEKKRGVYDFAWMDHIVDDAISRGVQPWIQISYGNPIYPGGGGASLGQGLVHSEEAMDAFAAYARALVRRYSDRVNEWEIWNEADHRHNREAGSDEFTYAKLFVKIARAVRSVQPDARIVALSMAGMSRTDFVRNFFDYLVDNDALDLVDVVTFHGYPTNPDVGFETLNTFIEIISSYNPEIEFWQGETGCPSTLGSTGALRNHPWTEHTQAKWNMRRALAHTGRDFNFSLFLLSEFVYNDALRKGLNSKGILKINEEDFSIQYPKPAYFAYQNLCSVFGRDLETIIGAGYEADIDEGISVYAWKDIGGKAIVAYWDSSDIPSDEDSFSAIDLRLKQMDFNKPVLVNPLTGEVKRVPRKRWSREGQDVVFQQLPFYDAPFLIAEKELIRIAE